VTTVNEAGLYSLILRSRKPEAKSFKRWITHEVLPAIRRTGTYSVDETRAIPHDFASALRELLSEVESHAETRAELEVAAPRAEAWNALASAEGDYSVGDAAKILARAGIQTGPTRLFSKLYEIKWTYRGSDGRPRAFADRVEKGFLYEKPSFHYHPGTGERVVDAPQVRVTVKGIEKLRQRLHEGALQAVGS
jgi:phage antirepressor YoqD-like protein